MFVSGGNMLCLYPVQALNKNKRERDKKEKESEDEGEGRKECT